ncbi:MAG TPA: porin family protein [Parafilimonas sp.]|nr:porin family protein [Parafilimonas sp.]
MKQKILIMMACIPGIPFLLNAQKISYEISAGISSACYTVNTGSDELSEFKTGFAGGFAVNFKTGKYWAIQPGLSYVQKGGMEKDFSYGVEYYTTLNYLELPVNVTYSKRDRFFLGFGPYAAYGLSGKIKAKGMDEGAKIKFGNGADELKPFEAGVNLLIGYRLPNRMSFSLNIATSASNISNDD